MRKNIIEKVFDLLLKPIGREFIKLGKPTTEIIEGVAPKLKPIIKK